MWREIFEMGLPKLSSDEICCGTVCIHATQSRVGIVRGYRCPEPSSRFEAVSPTTLDAELKGGGQGLARQFRSKHHKNVINP